MDDSVRKLTPEDGPWMAGLMEARRNEYERYSPIFWRPAPGATTGHASFLTTLLGDDQFIGLGTDNGFVLVRLLPGRAEVDDFAVDDPSLWKTSGRRLLLEGWRAACHRGAEDLRVVTAARDRPKVAMLESLGMTPVVEWWVKPLAPLPQSAPALGPSQGEHYKGVVLSAPPVYSPGGPVMLVQTHDGERGLIDAEAAAQASGAVLSVASVDLDGAEITHLRGRGYEIASRFYGGRPGT